MDGYYWAALFERELCLGLMEVGEPPLLLHDSVSLSPFTLPRCRSYVGGDYVLVEGKGIVSEVMWVGHFYMANYNHIPIGSSVFSASLSPSPSPFVALGSRMVCGALVFQWFEGFGCGHQSFLSASHNSYLCLAFECKRESLLLGSP
eukprot:Gb_31836 [translate_table: standard]